MLVGAVGGIEPQVLKDDMLIKLKKNERHDGRKMNESRPMTKSEVRLEPMPTAFVTIGGTSVVCGIKAELSPCDPHYPDEGRVHVDVTAPLVGNSIPAFVVNEQCSALVADVLDFLSLEAILPSRKPLCIRSGEACWLLFVDVVVLSVDGSLRGAIMEGVQQCFRNLKLPAMELPDGTTSTPVDLRPSKDAESLATPTTVRCVTIAAIAASSENDTGTSYLVVDPNSAEETVADGIISAVITTSTATVPASSSAVRVLSLSYHGGCAISMSAVGECLKQYTF